jgi:tRNA A-37 threonylcarbamoyl transferase component Bud32
VAHAAITVTMFVKEVSIQESTNEIKLQRVAISHGFSPAIISTGNFKGKCYITMEKIHEHCLADKYGENPEDIPEWIWAKIRKMVLTLLEEDEIEYRDITPYNFIEKDGKVWMIDFGHAKYKDGEVDWFVQEFIDGENSWNPDYK